MKTVKEISELTGISARTLHWYDEIGLLKPTKYTAAGYRLYDDKALGTLQQILFFREFDMPLKEIKAALADPALDQKAVLQKQRYLLTLKQRRLARLIASIDSILKGENDMDLTVFDTREIEQCYTELMAQFSERQRARLAAHYGSLDAWHAAYVEQMQTPKAQAYLQKLVEWYGGKEQAKRGLVGVPRPEAAVRAGYEWLQAALCRLAGHKGEDPAGFAVKQCVGELDYVVRRNSGMEDARPLLLDMAAEWLESPDAAARTDAQYGAGAAAFFGMAVMAFYGA